MKLRDHKNKWFLRMTVYKPEEGPGPGTHSHVGVEGPIHPRLGQFLEELGLRFKYLNGFDFDVLDRISKTLLERKDRERYP